MDLLRQNMDIELMCAERETFGWVTVEGMRSLNQEMEFG